MAKSVGWWKTWIGSVLAGLIVMPAVPVQAQETPEQFNDANAENRRHSEAERALRNQERDLRTDRAKALLQCQGAGSAAAQKACAGNAEIDTRQRDLDLGNRSIQERNTHNQILKGIGVHRVP
jgi:hypothetical protein